MRGELNDEAGYGRQWHMTMPYDSATPVTVATPPVIYQTLSEYASTNNKHPRTVKRWLADNELPGAYQDENGHWKIPVDATRTTSAPPSNGNVITISERGGNPGSQRAVARSAESAAVPPLDSLPSFLTIEQAAQVLAPVTEYAIAANKEYYGVVKHGEKGQMLVPLATIKRIRGA